MTDHGQTADDTHHAVGHECSFAPGLPGPCECGNTYAAEQVRRSLAEYIAELAGSQTVTAGMVQRKVRVGYARAAYLPGARRGDQRAGFQGPLHRTARDPRRNHHRREHLMTDTPQTARDDTAAIAAYAARYKLDAEAAAADWRFLVEGEREYWRAVAGGNAPAETGMTPGQAIHESLRGSAVVAFGRSVGDFEAWEDVPPGQRERLEAAGQDVLKLGACPHGDQAAEITRLRARIEADDGQFRDVLEALCDRDGLSLESAAVRGQPAANYELADRLGIGRVFGLQPGEVRTCYCGTTATVVPGVFPHPDCDGSVPWEPKPAPAPARPRRPPLAVRDFLTGRELSVSETTHDTRPAPELAVKASPRVDWARVSEAVAERESERDEARAGRDAAEADRDGLRSLAAEILADFWPEDLREGASEGLRDQQARVDGYRERARIDSDGNLLQPGAGNELQPARESDYKAYADGLFAPVKDEVARLRAQLGDPDGVSVDIGSPEDGDHDRCEPTL